MPLVIPHAITHAIVFDIACVITCALLKLLIVLILMPLFIVHAIPHVVTHVPYLFVRAIPCVIVRIDTYKIAHVINIPIFMSLLIPSLVLLSTSFLIPLLKPPIISLLMP